MNVSLTPELERYLQEKVETGRYHSASEVMREALRALEREEQQYKVKLAALRTATEGDASGVAGDDPFARVRRVRKPTKEARR
jgi:antitoxin ParD1/3/4